jgi:1,2-diacylglycerol 3-alpha-glucosyltransferase
MRIAVYSDNFYPELSGISDTIIASGKELAKRGHRINYFVPKYGKKNYDLLKLPCEEIFLHENIKITRFPSFSFPTGTKQSRFVVPSGLGSFSLKKFNPDVIHTNLIAGVGMEALLDAGLLKKPLVGTNHTPIVQFLSYSPIKGKVVQKIVSKYDAWYYDHCKFVSSPSSPVLEEMKKYGFKAPCGVVPNPVDVDLFTPPKSRVELKKKYGISGFSLFYAGRLAPEKNVDMMVKAAANLRRVIPEINVVIAGKGSSEQSLKKLIEDSGLNNNSKFFGFIDSPQKFAELYNANDIFIMMSVAETQSISMMNAMACEMGVVSTNAWGLKDYAKDGVNSLVVEPGDQKALEEKILHLYKNKQELEKLGKQAREYVCQFSPSKIAKMWEDIYETAINSYKKT